jgi:prevent-host-death family protein
MQRMSARAAKNGFGLLIDTARAEPVAIEKHGRPVVVVVSVEEYRRLVGGRDEISAPAKPSKKKRSTG